MKIKTITVQQLIDELQDIQDKLQDVYMLTDKSESNYDEDGNPITVHGIATIRQEEICSNDGWNDALENNIILETNESTD